MQRMATIERHFRFDLGPRGSVTECTGSKKVVVYVGEYITRACRIVECPTCGRMAKVAVHGEDDIEDLEA